MKITFRSLGEHEIETSSLDAKEMCPSLADCFYRRLSRRELRDLLWATQSSDTCPFVVLIVLIEANSKLRQLRRTFIARTDADLAEFCEVVAETVAKQMQSNEHSKQISARKFPVENRFINNRKKSSQENTEEDADLSTTQVTEDRRVHLIFSDHPYCLWKPCLNVLEGLLRMRGSLVVQHRFSRTWIKRVECI